jgi:hypothetical protein
MINSGDAKSDGGCLIGFKLLQVISGMPVFDPKQYA